MGWTGAMSGLGKGMSSYAGVMRDQQKMNWKAQQESVANERQTNLEKLRASNQRTLAEDQRDWRTKEGEAARKFQEKQGALKIKAGQENVTQADKLARERIPIEAKARATGMTAEIEAKSAAKIKDVEAAIRLTNEMKASERKNSVKEFLASPQASSMDEERREFLAFAIEFPQEAAMMASMDKANRGDTEQFTKVFLKAREEWDSIDKNAKKAFQLKNPNVTDPNEMKDLYARSVAFQGTGINTAPSVTPEVAQGVLSPAAMQKARANPTMITEDDVMSTSDPNQQAELKSLMQGQVKAPGALKADRRVPVESSYVFGRPGQKIPDAMHKTFDRKPVDNTGISERQKQLPWN